ncbi:MAG TPA: glycosyl hydrolase family 8 [Ideonella sp.]|jgi:endo-1,4-beta-D-glucanase Y|nr:glycosyl hydrolase family 8 [Ideonella sp.]
MTASRFSVSAGVALAALTAALLAACGGGGDEDNAPPPTEAQAPRIGARSQHGPVLGTGAIDSQAGDDEAAASAPQGDIPPEVHSYAITPQATARPFPYHVTYTAGAIKPSNVSQSAMDSKVSSHYSAWKTNYLRTLGGQGTWVKYDDTNSTVSEAHGYGMVLAAYMGDKTTFDSMYGYFTKHYSGSGPHLMSWKQTYSGGTMKNVEGNDSATDGDLDIAYSLLLAHVQWGSTGSINYKARGLEVMHDILNYEVNQSYWNLTPGDWASGTDANHTRPSDFMGGHILAFAKYDTANTTKWNNVYNTIAAAVNYQYTHGSGATGLMPDFEVRSGSNFVPVAGTYLEGKHDGDFSYNACRTPWRLAMSWLNQGRTDMLAPQQKMASWIRGKTSSTPVNIRAGYYVKNGTNGNSFVSYDDLAFTAPMVVNAMLGGSAAQTWLNKLWASITGGDYGTHVDYFGDSIRMQVLITVSGNWWAP